MRARHKQSGLSLIEMVVVVAMVAMLASLSTPAVKALFDSMATKGGAKAMISAGLATARAIAAKEQRYAGVRFQTDNPDDPLGASVSQYMVFIINEEPRKMGGLANGFRAVEGIEPVKLPDNIGVTDLRYRLNLVDPAIALSDRIDVDSEIDDDHELRDTTSFSIIFSPSGKLVIHDVRVRNRHGKFQPDNNNATKTSLDDVFNSPENMDNYNIGMFVQDDYANLGLGEEPSRNMFIIYDRELFKQAYDAGKAYSDYLYPMELRDEFIYINPYMGTIVSAGR